MTFTTAKDFATLRDISDEEEESDDCDDLDGHNSTVSGHSSNLSGSNLSGSSTSRYPGLKCHSMAWKTARSAQ